MKQITTKIATLMALALVSALPALAAEGMGNATAGNGQNQKDQCLLVAQACTGQQDTIQQRIRRLNHEIGKGTGVYSREELRQLNYQLQDSYEMLNVLTYGGGS
jgi:TolA-binding protein